jgi:hypothetical protein
MVLIPVIFNDVSRLIMSVSKFRAVKVDYKCKNLPNLPVVTLLVFAILKFGFISN